MSLQEKILNGSVPNNITAVSLIPEGQYYPSPADWRDEVLYFLLVDRFSDGEDGKRPKLDRKHPDSARKTIPGKTVWDWSEWYSSGKDRWQGGTLKGVMSRLDYLEKLGITAVWLSPVFKQRGHLNTFHGYGIQNFLDVDPRFGTRKDLADLVGAGGTSSARIRDRSPSASS